MGSREDFYACLNTESRMAGIERNEMGMSIAE